MYELPMLQLYSQIYFQSLNAICDKEIQLSFTTENVEMGSANTAAIGIGVGVATACALFCFPDIIPGVQI